MELLRAFPFPLGSLSLVIVVLGKHESEKKKSKERPEIVIATTNATTCKIEPKSTPAPTIPPPPASSTLDASQGIVFARLENRNPNLPAPRQLSIPSIE